MEFTTDMSSFYKVFPLLLLVLAANSCIEPVPEPEPEPSYTATVNGVNFIEDGTTTTIVLRSGTNNSGMSILLSHIDVDDQLAKEIALLCFT